MNFDVPIDDLRDAAERYFDEDVDLSEIARTYPNVIGNLCDVFGGREQLRKFAFVLYGMGFASGGKHGTEMLAAKFEKLLSGLKGKTP